MKNLCWSVLTAALFGLVLFGAGCTAKTETPSQTTVGNDKPTEAPAGTEVAKRDNALVRFMNASNEPVDLYFGDMKAFAQVEGQKVTAYMELPAERHELKLEPSGKDPATAPLATNSEGLSEGVHYTAVAFNNKDGSAGIALLQDDLTKPAEGKARIRVVNVATGVDEVDVYPAGQKDTLVKGVNFSSATGYQEVDPPSIKALEVHRSGEKAVATRVADLSLSPGKTYTIFVLNGRKALTAIPVEDQLIG